MKKLLSLAVLGGLLAAQQCSAFEVWVNVDPNYSFAWGGEYNITSKVPDPTFTYLYERYAAVAQLNGGFETFCISTAVNLQSNPLDASLDPNGVALGTAWLYQQFATGTLQGYDYMPGAGRGQSAWALQNAIWGLQGFAIPDPTAASVFLPAVEAEFGTLAAARVQSVNEIVYGTEALRMTYLVPGTPGIVSQPMLAYVPDGGATLILLGLGLSGLGAFARRFRA